MTTPIARDSAPGLADVLRVVLRWRLLVVLFVVGGAVFGLTALPTLTAPAPSTKASVRLDVKPLPASVEPRATPIVVGRGQRTPDPSERYQDTAVMNAVLAELGTKAKELTVLQGVLDKNQLRVATRSISAAPIPGTTQVRFSFVDQRSGVARDVVSSYASLYATSRNATYASAMDALIKTAGETAKQDYDNLLKLSRQADAERAASGSGMTTTTQVLLDLASKKYDASGARLNDLVRTRTSGVVPTKVLGDVTLIRLDSPPRRLLLLVIGLLLGSVLGVGLALILDAVRDRVTDEDDVVAVTGSPVVLAAVPARGRARRGITVLARPDGEAAAALNRARLALELQGVGRGTVLAVTSAEPGDGRSTVTVNVAASRAADDQPVVVVCADLASRDVEEYFGLQAEPGLTDLLVTERASVESALVSVAPHLMVLPGGTAGRGAAELRRTNRLIEVLNELRSWGTVLVDAPPGLAAETLSVVAASDVAMVVTRAGHTHRKTLRALCSQLEHWGKGSIGTVLVGRSGLLARMAFGGGLKGVSPAPGHEQREPVAAAPANPLTPVVDV